MELGINGVVQLPTKASICFSKFRWTPDNEITEENDTESLKS